MRPLSLFHFRTLLGLILLLLFSSFLLNDTEEKKLKLPYKKAGLNERQAAAHLLSRFTYGAKPGDVDKLVEEGLEKWLKDQLNANLKDDTLTAMLKKYDAINLSNADVARIFPNKGRILKMAIKEGIVSKDSAKEQKEKISEFMKQKGFRSQKELFRQFIDQKILRAAYSNNQLQEVLTGFWFNHFNVSISKGQCAEFIPAYERETIRPNVLQNFESLLTATAKSPAILYYLDNSTNSGVKEGDDNMTQNIYGSKEKKRAKKNMGLNENYARELMELHTLGVDGGYAQEDVTNAAKILTGWTVSPMINKNYNNVNKINDNKQLKKETNIIEGDFMFAGNRHDRSEKIVLGKKYSEGGYDEGLSLLSTLAHHQSTATFISKKLATFFVSDNPPASLVNKMSKTFIDTNGSIKEVIITMVTSMEFWSSEALREKTKSPMELAISTVRTLNASIDQPFQLNKWISKMGQNMYYYQAPTGFPDKGQYWISTGSLLNRMNFGMAISSHRIPGISFNLAALNHYHEPESAEAALLVYCKLMLPERNIDATIKRLSPILKDYKLETKLEVAAMQAPLLENDKKEIMSEMSSMKEEIESDSAPKEWNNKSIKREADNSNAMLSQVVGVIIGSPEFQRK